MLPLSRKPQIIRLHHLEQIQRARYMSQFTNIGYEWLPSALSPFLPLIADIYYTSMTIVKCRKRLGEEYTYVVKYNEKQYGEEGVLMNRKTRVLMTVLEIFQRYVVKKICDKVMNKLEGSGSFFLREVSAMGVEGVLEEGRMFMLMLFMLGWNPHFNLVDTILQTRYVYTYKNADEKKVDYKIQGILLLIVFLVKIGRKVYQLACERKKHIEKKSEGQIKKDFEALKEEEESMESGGELCRICYDTLKATSSTCCGHIFCWECIIRHLETSPECPVCRAECQPREVTQLQNY